METIEYTSDDDYSTPMTDEVIVDSLKGLNEWMGLLNESRNAESVRRAIIRACGPYDAEMEITVQYIGDEPCKVVIDGCKTLGLMREVRRALGGGRWVKERGDYYYTESREFSPHLTVQLKAYRENVCKKVQVGTETVEVPDYSRAKQPPMKTVTRPVYEWQCES